MLKFSSNVEGTISGEIPCYTTYERGKDKGNRNLVAMVRETCCELQFSILSNFLDTHEGTENLFSSWTARSEDYSLSFEFLNSRNP